MSIMARYSGTCEACGERYQPGDLIRAEAHPLGSLPEWRHVTCPDTPSDFEHHAPVCETCWLSHPLTADCDEW